MRSFFVLFAVVCAVGSALATQAVPNQSSGFKKVRRTPDSTEGKAYDHVNW